MIQHIMCIVLVQFCLGEIHTNHLVFNLIRLLIFQSLCIHLVSCQSKWTMFIISSQQLGLYSQLNHDVIKVRIMVLKSCVAKEISHLQQACARNLVLTYMYISKKKYSYLLDLIFQTLALFSSFFNYIFSWLKSCLMILE